MSCIQIKMATNSNKGDGFTVGKKVKLVHITFSVLNGEKAVLGPGKIFTLALYAGREDYGLLKVRG